MVAIALTREMGILGRDVAHGIATVRGRDDRPVSRCPWISCRLVLVS